MASADFCLIALPVAIQSTPHVKQISLDKLMNSGDKAASFTVPAGSPGFVIWC
jgi:hypothetical protein